jgi:hypothetical protein
LRVGILAGKGRETLLGALREMATGRRFEVQLD